MLPLVPTLGLALSLVSFQQVPVRPPADTLAAPVVAEAAVEAAAEAAAEAATGTADAVTRLRVRPIFSPESLYPGSRGAGLNGGVAVSNLARGGDHLQVEGLLAQHQQSAFGTYQTGEPRGAPLFGLVGASVLTTTRFGFHGTGPHSDPDGKLFLDRSGWELEGRVGWSPAGPRGVLLQPTVRYRADRLRGYTPVGDTTLAHVMARDRLQLDGLVGDARSGFSAGLSALWDTRNNEARPVRGAYLQGAASRFFSTDGSGLRFNRVETTGYLFRPAPFRLPFQPERGAVYARATGVVVRESGADGLPFLYLPVLRHDLLVGWPEKSFVGQDALSVGVGARGVVVNRVGAFRIEGNVLALVGAAYDDVFREFTPRVSFSSDPVAEGADVPLRPSVGFGLNLHYRDSERPIFGALLGVGPHGLDLTSFRLVIGLERYRPEVR